MHEEWDQLLRDGRALRDALAEVRGDDVAFDAWVRDNNDDHGLARNNVVRDSRLNQTFAYQVIAGTRHATRDKLIQLAFGMRLSAVETCELLERGGANALLTRSRRDVVIGWCLQRGRDVSSCDDLLWELGEKTLTGGAARRDPHDGR